MTPRSMLSRAPLLLALLAFACDSERHQEGTPTHGILPGGPPPEGVVAATESGGSGEHEPAGDAKDGEEDVVKDPLPGVPSGPHPFSVHDLLAMQRISSPVVAPDGSQVVWVQSETDYENNKSRADLWAMTLPDGEPRRLTTDEGSERSPHWSADGQNVYFTSARSGSNQVWKISAGGGEATQVTDLEMGIANFELSANGDHLLFSLDVFVDCNDLACTKERLEKTERQFQSGRSYDRVFVRHWDQWKDGRRTHMFALPVSGEGTPVDLTSGMDADTPSRPFGGPDEVTTSPDGQFAVWAARDAAGGSGEPQSTNFDLFVSSLEGGASRKLTENPAWDTHPVFSPDGSTLAWLAMERPGFEADRFRIVVADFNTGRLENQRVITQDWDRSVSDLVFNASGDTLYVTTQDVGHKAIYSVPLAGGEPTVVFKDGAAGSLSVAGSDLIFTRNDLGGPSELYTVPAAGGDARALTSVNAALLEKSRRGEFEQFSFKGAGGDEVFGWVVKPADFNPDEKYPIAFLIHGGPQGSFSNRFHYRWNPQVYAGAGYAAIMVDFHGSTGYGQDFTDAISGDWGGKPLVDLQKGLAAALEKYDFLDGERVCALGASYGGYMINWIAGKWSDRFQCLVNHDGIFDNRMMYYATEELWFPEWEHGGPYYDDPKAYERHNPANFVKNWKTPMLVVHGSLDYRVPLEQGLATFTALQRRGIESKFLHYGDENHWVLRPANSIQWHDEVLGWLDSHLNGEPAGTDQG